MMSKVWLPHFADWDHVEENWCPGKAEAIFQRMNDPHRLGIVQHSLKRVRERRDS